MAGIDDRAVATREAVPVSSHGAGAVVQTLRVVLLALVLTAIGAVLWQHPRTGTMAGLRHDLVTNRATDVRIVTESRTFLSFGQPWRLPDRHPALPYVEWVTSDHRVHDAQIGSGGFPGGYTNFGTAGYDGITNSELLPRPAQRDLSGWLDNAHRAQPGVTTNSWLGWLSLACVAVLLAGPATRRGTKWAWFWFTGTAPLGLGLVAWLAFERPWSRSLARTPDDRPPGPRWAARRRTGWAGLGWGLVVSIAVEALFQLVDLAL